MPVHPQHRSILALDIEGFGRPERTNPVRLWLRRRLREICVQLLRGAGAEPGRYVLKDTGDGLLVSVDGTIEKSRLLGIVPRLSRRLAATNRGKPPERQLRLRVALHAGEVLQDPDPMHGDPVIFTCRLLDADVVRACLAATTEPLALIVSQTIYDSIVKHEYVRDASAYLPVIVNVKETRKRAFVHVPRDADAPRRAGVVASAVELVFGEGPIPRELPPVVPTFSNRGPELGLLKEVLAAAGTAAAATTVAIDGAPGVGKSTLAVQAAHASVGHFPDGQLYIDLRDPAHGLTPLTSLQALHLFLHRLGFDTGTIPPTLPEATARYRSLLTGRRMLIVLDNASRTEQVRPLLPSGPGCAVVVTSRAALADLDTDVRLPLDVLEPRDAVGLLGRLVGPRVIATDPAAAADVAQLCDHLPLAIRIAGGRLTTRPVWTLRALAERLTDEHRRLDLLSLGSLGVTASFGTSYQALLDDPAGEDAAELFRRLGALDGPDFAVPVAAALLDAAPQVVERALERLVDEHLVEGSTPGRYRLHGLLRLFARARLDEAEPPAGQAGALIRALDFYLTTASRAATRLRPDFAPTDRPPSPYALGFDDPGGALRWLDEERASLAAVIGRASATPRVPPTLIPQFVHTLADYFDYRSAFDEWDRLSRIAVGVAERNDDLRGLGDALKARGRLAARRYRPGQASAYYRRALAAFRQVGDLHRQADALNNLGVVFREQGRHDEAAACYRRCIRVYRRLRRPLRVGLVLNNLANIHRDHGRYLAADRLYRRSIEICRGHGDLRGESNAIGGLGIALQSRGRTTAALAAYERELEISRELGDDRRAGMALFRIGDVHLDEGHAKVAIDYLYEALALHRRAMDQRSAARTLTRISTALSRLGRHDRARTIRREALIFHEQIGTPSVGLRRVPPRAR